MEQKSSLDRHIENISNKKIISFSDLIKLNNYNKKSHELSVGKYVTFQYNHPNNKNIFNKLPFLLVTDYSPYHVTGINMLNLNLPLRANIFNIIEKNNDIKLLHHHLIHVSKTHYLPFVQSYSFKNFQSHMLTFTKEHHNIIGKLPFISNVIGIEPKKVLPNNSEHKNTIKSNIIKNVKVS